MSVLWNVIFEWFKILGIYITITIFSFPGTWTIWMLMFLLLHFKCVFRFLTCKYVTVFSANCADISRMNHKFRLWQTNTEHIQNHNDKFVNITNNIKLVALMCKCVQHVTLVFFFKWTSISNGSLSLETMYVFVLLHYNCVLYRTYCLLIFLLLLPYFSSFISYLIFGLPNFVLSSAFHLGTSFTSNPCCVV